MVADCAERVAAKSPQKPLRGEQHTHPECHGHRNEEALRGLELWGSQDNIRYISRYGT